MRFQDEPQRRLAEIERVLVIEDPRFAEGLRTGRPRAPAGSRRWPVVLLGALMVLLLLAGIVLLAWPLALLGLAGTNWAVHCHRRRVVRGHHRRPPRIPGPDRPF